jgi:aspartyl/asparaginyl-tRNA synthetase
MHKKHCIAHRSYYIINIINFIGGKEMKNRIDELREHLHQTMESKNYEKMLKVSQELDELIVQYFKEKNCIEKGKD